MKHQSCQPALTSTSCLCHPSPPLSFPLHASRPRCWANSDSNISFKASTTSLSPQSSFRLHGQPLCLPMPTPNQPSPPQLQDPPKTPVQGTSCGTGSGAQSPHWEPQNRGSAWHGTQGSISLPAILWAHLFPSPIQPYCIPPNTPLFQKVV